MTLRYSTGRECSLLQKVAVVLRHGHATTVPQVTLCPLVATSTEYCLVSTRSGRLQIIPIIYLVDTTRSTSLRAVMALFLILKEVVGTILRIRWVQSLV